tara:strand:- start:2417 stop:2761 length:345 start_codon:yes stop_codon:yes gene_type:complete
MKKSIFANLPNNLIIKILNDRKEIKKIENYKKNYDIFVKDFTKRVNKWKRVNRTSPLTQCLEPTFDFPDPMYYEFISDHFDDEQFDNIILDFMNEQDELDPSQYRNELNHELFL